MNSLKINSNIYAMDALRQLNAVNSKVAMHQARLSTGKRINNAQDDAAAYAVIQKSYNTIKSNQAIKDGVRNGKNLLTMIEASMTTQMELWQRIKELDLQKSSGTLTNNQQAMIDERINSLIAELDDIANSTKWNGESLLNGTKSSIDIMVGEGEMMTIALPNTTSSGLGILTNSNTKSLSFDGVDDYVSISDSNDLEGMNELTVQLSVKFNSFGFQTNNKGSRLIEKFQSANANAVGSYAFYTHHDSDMLTFLVQTENGQKGANVSLTNNINTGQWNHLLGKYNGSTVEMYINGELKAQNNHTGTILSNSYPLEIGNKNDTNTQFFDGLIDEVSIINKSLTQSEITSLYNSGNPKSPLSLNTVSSNVIAHYNMEGGDGTLVDQSSNSHNGTIIGATRSSDNPGNITNTSISNTTTESLLSHLQTIGSEIQRLESKEEALMDQTTAQEAFRSSIEDADFAEEQMELIKAQIMQQTATTALSQANTAPQIILSLFQS